MTTIEEVSMEFPDTQENLPILVVEDSMADFQTMERMFRKAGINNPVCHCETGHKAMEFLQGVSGGDESGFYPRPGIILLDLNLPGIDGREVLRNIKSDANLKSIPVIIFTTSDAPNDISECYENGANSYITKPVDLEKFREVVELIRSYWFKTVVLPATT